MDPNWEFQAPQFVDFTKLGAEEDQDNADSFFDVDMESGGRVSQLFPENLPLDLQNLPKEETIPEEEPAKEEKEDRLKKKPSNMVTSWEGMNVKRMMMQGKPGQGQGPSTKPTRPVRKSAEAARKPAKQPENKIIKQTTAAATEKPAETQKESRARQQDTPTRAALRQQVAKVVEKVRNSPRLKPKRLGVHSEVPRLNEAEKSLHGASASLRRRTRSRSPGYRALPGTPEVMKRIRSKMGAVGSYAKETDAFKMRKAATLVDHSKPIRAQPAVKCVALTRPTEFKFATATRTSKDRRRSVSVPDAPDFSRMLRSYNKPAAESALNKELTKPVPFPRAESNSRKRRHSSDIEPKDQYKSMAEQIGKYQSGTPDRFRTLPRGRSNSPPRTRMRSQSPRLTVPKTPQLSTRGRSRPNHVLSQAEREQLELEEAKRHQFHAKGVGETLPKFKYGEVERKPCTVPKPFDLHEPYRPVPQPTEEKVESFHSRPLNKKILQGPVGVPERKLLPMVEPESPAFALKQRMATRKAPVEPQLEPERIVKAKPVPHFGVPLALPAASKRSTVPEPFSFSDRDHMTAKQKEERIKKLIEEEKAAREFHAQPIARGMEHPKLPERKVLPPTQPAPFKHAIEQRVETRLNKWQDAVKAELENQRQAALFKATEPKVLTKAPFIPKPSDKHLSEISNFTLHTDRRAEERMAYEIEKKKKEVDLDEMKRQREERKKREQEQEVIQLRKQAVHKAQPIREYKGISIKPSDRALTLPMSPRLSQRAKTNSTFNKTAASNP